MSYDRATIVDRAIAVLDAHGLADLTMRRLAADLGVRAGALYYHFENKQVMLAAVANELLDRRPRTVDRNAPWQEQVAASCHDMRSALVSVRGAAEVVATAYAFGLGAHEPVDELREVLAAAGFEPATARAGTDTLVHFVFGHTTNEQTLQLAQQVGASIGDRPEGSDFEVGIGLIIAGLERDAPDANRVESER